MKPKMRRPVLRIGDTVALSARLGTAHGRVIGFTKGGVAKVQFKNWFGHYITYADGVTPMYERVKPERLTRIHPHKTLRLG